MQLLSACQCDGGAVRHKVDSCAKRKRGFSAESEKLFIDVNEKEEWAHDTLYCLGALKPPIREERKGFQ